MIRLCQSGTLPARVSGWTALRLDSSIPHSCSHYQKRCPIAVPQNCVKVPHIKVRAFLAKTVPNPSRLGNPDEYAQLVESIVLNRLFTYPIPIFIMNVIICHHQDAERWDNQVGWCHQDATLITAPPGWTPATSSLPWHHKNAFLTLWNMFEKWFRMLVSIFTNTRQHGSLTTQRLWSVHYATFDIFVKN